jgi:hypothetical protein
MLIFPPPDDDELELLLTPLLALLDVVVPTLATDGDFDPPHPGVIRPRLARIAKPKKSVRC